MRHTPRCFDKTCLKLVWRLTSTLIAHQVAQLILARHVDGDGDGDGGDDDDRTTTTMSRSPSKPHAASLGLPPLRPSNSPTAPSSRKQTRIPLPHDAEWHFTMAAGTDERASPAASRATLQQSTRTPQIQNGVQPWHATSWPSPSADRDQTIPVPDRSSGRPQRASSTPALPAVPPPQTDSQSQAFDPPFFRLTHDEYRALRKKSHKPLAYKFSDFFIARQLGGLGRGWGGFIRARKKAEQEGRLERFQRQLQAELDETARLGGGTLPPGAVSMKAAEEAASKIRLPSASHGHKERRPRRIQLAQADISRTSLEIGDAETERTTRLQNVRPGGQESSIAHTIPSPELGEEPPLPSLPANRARPRRVNQMPDYRIRTIDEAEREAESEDSPDTQPTRPPSPSPRAIYDAVQPSFVQFICEWKGCQAVLDNLSRLRKHVGVVHGHEARKRLRCSWGTCGQFEKGDLAAPVAFATLAELDDHMESRHMDSLMWHLGDGRKGLGFVVDSSDDCPSYLLWNGIQVTPSVKGQKIETLPECQRRKVRLKEFLSMCNLAGDSEVEPDSESPGDEDGSPPLGR